MGGAARGRGHGPDGGRLLLLRAATAPRHPLARQALAGAEDDVPHVRDRLERVRNGAGLAPTQLRTAPSLIAAMSAGLGGDDLVLCTGSEAVSFGLRWRALGDLRLVRGYAVAGRERELLARFLEFAGADVAELLQSAPVAGGPSETRPTRGGTHAD